MIQLFEDLRFFIGAFFLIVGAILTGAGLVNPTEIAGVNLNLLVGVCFIIFGAGALVMAVLFVRSLKR